MKIGDYVRTKYGIIGKIESKNLIGYNDWIIDTLYYNDDEIIDDWTCGIKEYDILKSSPNIIDLIEVGDYVNGTRVNFVYSPDGKQVFRIELDVDGLKGHMICESKHIKSIVTHEQFESMQYNLESEVN